jgi:predicted PurR-regulated permease PerM
MNRVATKVWVALGVTILMAGVMVACGPDKEELEVQNLIQQQITVIDNQVKGLESHQAKMREMIASMQAQLEAMQKELDNEAPKLEAASKGILSLREYTTMGLGESPGMETLKNPSVNWAWVILFVLVVWVLYRVRHRKSQA